MEFNIVSEKDEPLMSRKEVMATIAFEAATPKNESVAQKCADVMKTDVEKVFVKKISNDFGLKTGKAVLRVYKSAEDMKRIEKVKEKKKDGE